ncbi:MAG: hypothetical protein US53_C0056G0012 [Candidatus Woesebacteria bacterium GW2011_GWA1_37_7]|uniref:Uncharacterized protein n=1 Tax=Candidatus Woesebacteria bacterium GW2011_GWA1_37_7 TaxID=1618545 RepID=A0A0G0H2G3_9BACT|nr:MAG: hypothetical protein US53_C0056G0012 [Candidatus Woesebacteria bacterium GW2011_GWA1_37_7]
MGTYDTSGVIYQAGNEKVAPILQANQLRVKKTKVISDKSDSEKIPKGTEQYLPAHPRIKNHLAKSDFSDIQILDSLSRNNNNKLNPDDDKNYFLENQDNNKLNRKEDNIEEPRFYDGEKRKKNYKENSVKKIKLKLKKTKKEKIAKEKAKELNDLNQLVKPKTSAFNYDILIRFILGLVIGTIFVIVVLFGR